MNDQLPLAIVIAVGVAAACFLLAVAFYVGIRWLKFPLMVEEKLNRVEASLNRIDTRMANWEAGQREATHTAMSETQ